MMGRLSNVGTMPEHIDFPGVALRKFDLGKVFAPSDATMLRTVLGRTVLLGNVRAPSVVNNNALLRSLILRESRPFTMCSSFRPASRLRSFGQSRT